ncbi:MAG: zinc ribbon domain-containing protein [bacterium]
MEYVIIWLLFGIVSAVAASSKGRSGCGWFILGVLLGPFGLILVLVLPNLKKQEKEGRQEVEQSRRVSCPYCAELILPEAKVCYYCGKELKDNWYVPPKLKPSLAYDVGKYVTKRFDAKDWVALIILLAIIIVALLIHYL